ncbi:hypothetical protein JCM17845_12880 [Iodidimonas gelatinilytica]|uniref:SSD domain-containing protein n=1 Tax=Iodidimonas gelatinilytica TaxID=1236966 RepID=A0A5A7MYY1_9PROT|nr:MMPL family transporter [Iodidimonas gelatinilytica]GER00665.1 hypothetical protein JCM17845_12880 [Iodidimonas gelatinilytica]
MKVRQGTERVIEKALLHWVGGIGRHPALALMALALLTGLAIFAALNDLKINTDSSEMIDGREPFRVNARAMDDAFPNLKNQILVIVRADTPDEADYVTGALADSLKTRRDLFQDVFSPASDPFFQRQGLLFLDLGDLIDMSSKMSSSGPLLRELMDNPGIEGFFTQLSRAAQASEEGIGLPMVAGAYREVADVIDALLQGEKRPLSWQHMFGRDDAINQRVLVIHPILDYQSLQPARAAVDAVRAAIDSLPDEIVEAADIALTGDPVLRTEELKSVSQGIEISALVSLILVAALLMIGLRRWQFVLSALLGLVVSIILTAGFAALAIGELNLVSIAFTVLLIGLGIDFAIHLLLQYREQRGRHADHFAAMAAAISEVGPALFLATVTTSFAFFAFVPTRFVGMAQLGIISGIGVLIAFAVAITLIPACLALWPKTAPPPNALPPVKEPSLWRRRITYGLAGGTVLLSLVAATALPNVRFDADPMNLRDPQSLAVLAFELLFDRDQDVPYRLNYLAPDHEAAQAFTAAVKEKPAVRTTISLIALCRKIRISSWTRLIFWRAIWPSFC